VRFAPAPRAPLPEVLASSRVVACSLSPFGRRAAEMPSLVR
jgi:hypothetical protein